MMMLSNSLQWANKCHGRVKDFYFRPLPHAHAHAHGSAFAQKIGLLLCGMREGALAALCAYAAPYPIGLLA